MLQCIDGPLLQLMDIIAVIIAFGRLLLSGPRCAVEYSMPRYHLWMSMMLSDRIIGVAFHERKYDDVGFRRQFLSV